MSSPAATSRRRPPSRRSTSMTSPGSRRAPAHAPSCTRPAAVLLPPRCRPRPSLWGSVASTEFHQERKRNDRFGGGSAGGGISNPQCSALGVCVYLGEDLANPNEHVCEWKLLLLGGWIGCVSWLWCGFWLVRHCRVPSLLVFGSWMSLLAGLTTWIQIAQERRRVGTSTFEGRGCDLDDTLQMVELARIPNPL